MQTITWQKSPLLRLLYKELLDYTFFKKTFEPVLTTIFLRTNGKKWLKLAGEGFHENSFIFITLENVQHELELSVSLDKIEKQLLIRAATTKVVHKKCCLFWALLAREFGSLSLQKISLKVSYFRQHDQKNLCNHCIYSFLFSFVYIW